MTSTLMKIAPAPAIAAGALASGGSPVSHSTLLSSEPLVAGAQSTRSLQAKSSLPGCQCCQIQSSFFSGQNSSVWLSVSRKTSSSLQGGGRVSRRPRVWASADGGSSVDTPTASEPDSRPTLRYTEASADGSSFSQSSLRSALVTNGSAKEKASSGFSANSGSVMEPSGFLQGLANGEPSQTPETDSAGKEVQPPEDNGHAVSQASEPGPSDGGSNGDMGAGARASEASGELSVAPIVEFDTVDQVAPETSIAGSQFSPAETNPSLAPLLSTAGDPDGATGTWPASRGSAPELVSEVTFSAEELATLAPDGVPAGEEKAAETSPAPAAAQGREDGRQQQQKPKAGRWGEVQRGRWTRDKQVTSGEAVKEEQKGWRKRSTRQGQGQVRPVAGRQVAVPEMEAEKEAELSSQSVRDPDVEYYEPKVGDEVMGVVVSASPFSAELDIGAFQCARLSAREAVPLDQFPVMEERALEQVFVLPETPEEQEAMEPPVCFVRKVVEAMDRPKLPQLFQRSLDSSDKFGKRKVAKEQPPLVEVGSAVRVEVVGTTIRGAPLVSMKKVSQRIAWQRVQQMEIEKEPFEVDIVDWNTGGAVAYVEGLRAFIPTSYILNPEDGVAPNPANLVGKKMKVIVTETDRKSGRLILSQLAASIYYDDKLLKIGSVVECQVVKLLAYGVMLRIVGTVKKGLMHISNVSRVHVEDVGSVFQPGEDIRAIVIGNDKGRIALSTRDLESSDGLILEDKAKVWEEAEQMAEVFRDEYHDEILAAQDEAAEASKASPDLEGSPPLANAEWLAFELEPEVS